MVAVWLKNFENFKGVDYRASPLTRDRFYARELINYRSSEGSSIRGVEGFNCMAQLGPYGGLHNYTRLERSDGSTSETLLSCNGFLWKLKKETLTITGASLTGTPGTTFYARIKDPGDGSQTFEIIGSATSFTQGIGVGVPFFQDNERFPNLWPYTMWELATAIDASASFACTLPDRSGQVTSFVYPLLTMVAGHTISEMDITSAYDSGSYDDLLPLFICDSTGANTFNCSTWIETEGTFNFGVCPYIGPGATPACAIDSITYGANQIYLNYTFWEPVSLGYSATTTATGPVSSMHFRYAPMSSWHKNAHTTTTQLPSMRNARDVCYIGSHYFPNESDPVQGYLLKYDGQNVYRAGLPQPKNASVSAVAASGILADGTYRYLLRWKHVDAQDNVTYSKPFELPALTAAATDAGLLDFYPITSCRNLGATTAISAGNKIPFATTTYSPGNDIINAGDVIAVYNSNETYTLYNIIQITGTGFIVDPAPGAGIANGTTILRLTDFAFCTKYSDISAVTNNVLTVGEGHGFQPGDPICFLDWTATAGIWRIFRAKLSSVTATTLTWDANLYGNASAVNGYVSVTCGMSLEIFRTTVNGTAFLLLDEIVLHAFTGLGLQYLDDKIAEADLGYELIDQPIGLEFDLPPKGHMLELHQGCLVVAGEEPNSIRWSLPGEYEYFPQASNQLDVPSNVKGEIRAIISDEDSKLVVFKERAHYQLDGDFASPGGVNTNLVSEGDYGCSSHSALTKAKGAILGIGKMGIVAHINDRINNDLGMQVDPVFQNDSDLRFTRAAVFNDPINREAVFFVSGSGGSTDDDFSEPKCFAYDYWNGQRWFERNYGRGTTTGFNTADKYYSMGALFNPIGGAALYEDRMWIHSMILDDDLSYLAGGLVFKFHPKYEGSITPERQIPSLYSSCTFPITNIFTPTWETLGEPSLFKYFKRLRVWSLPSEFESKTAFGLTITGFRDFNTSTTWDSFTQNFSSASTIQKTSHLRGDLKSLSFSPRMISNSLTASPFITGLELICSVYSKEDILE